MCVGVGLLSTRDDYGRYGANSRRFPEANEKLGGRKAARLTRSEGAVPESSDSRVRLLPGSWLRTTEGYGDRPPRRPRRTSSYRSRRRGRSSPGGHSSSTSGWRTASLVWPCSARSILARLFLGSKSVYDQAEGNGPRRGGRPRWRDRIRLCRKYNTRLPGLSTRIWHRAPDVR
jgi:hypothetical protein